MPMFRNANYIYTVYRERNFSRAAEKLFISQSSLSLTIKKAEERIGAPIFNRSTSPITLTEFGEKYIEAVEEMIRIQNRLDNYIYDINHMKRGHIAVGAANFNSTYLLPHALSAFREMYPNVVVDLYENTTPDLEKKLGRGDIDLLFTNKTLDERLFHRFIICHEFMVLVVPKKFCLDDSLKKFSRTIPELSSFSSLSSGGDSDGNRSHLLDPAFLYNFRDLPFILRRPGNDSRERSDLMFLDAGFYPQDILELDQASTAYRLACSGMGATIVSNLMVRKMEPSESTFFFPLGGPHTEQYVCAYLRSDAIITKAMEEFVKTAQTISPANI